jgi:hypothetical protein
MSLYIAINRHDHNRINRDQLIISLLLQILRVFSKINNNNLIKIKMLLKEITNDEKENTISMINV